MNEHVVNRVKRSQACYILINTFIPLVRPTNTPNLVLCQIVTLNPQVKAKLRKDLILSYTNIMNQPMHNVQIELSVLTLTSEDRNLPSVAGSSILPSERHSDNFCVLNKQ